MNLWTNGVPRGKSTGLTDLDGIYSVVPGQIDHIIMVMMENRSYDHWYGARKLLEGRAQVQERDRSAHDPARRSKVFQSWM